MKDDLGKRMKEFYEDRVRYYLPRRSYVIIRIDGKAFHTYTKGLKKPFDSGLIADMNETTKYLCEHIQGAKFGYTQSDEISILVTDFETHETAAWFDNNIQKMVSVAASMATAKFNQLRPGKIAMFDARVFTIPSWTEVGNYFVWRQKDCIRNSVASMAQSIYSHNQLKGVSVRDMVTKMENDGYRWNELEDGLKNGRVITRKLVMKPNPLSTEPNYRSEWIVEPADLFTNLDYKKHLIPNIENF
jgi:tRNA(His) 5'-end guanylyltransferase